MNWINLENLTWYTNKLKEWIKKNIYAKDIIQDDNNKLVNKTQVDSWDSKYDVSNTVTDEEIQDFLNPDLIKEVFELANEEEIKMLFKGTSLEGGETYNLTELTPDETKMVNMKLLSLYNDLVSQKINGKVSKSTTLHLGPGLTGSTDFSKDVVSISLISATNEQIEEMFSKGGF